MGGVASLRQVRTAAICPIKGLYFLLTNPDLWTILVEYLKPSAVFSAGVYPLAYHYIFPAQYGLFQKYHGHGALIDAIALTLSECLVIIQAFYGGYSLDQSTVDIFDATLIKLSHKHHVGSVRHLKAGTSNAVTMLGEHKVSIPGQPWDLFQIADVVHLTDGRYREFMGLQLVIYLPLHFIPYVGTPAFLVLAGHAYAQFLQQRWCQMQKLSKAQAEHEAQTRWWEYTAFGSVALILQLIPLVSFLAFLSNSTGSAIWAISTLS